MNNIQIIFCCFYLIASLIFICAREEQHGISLDQISQNMFLVLIFI